MITDRSEERDLHAAVCASPKDDAPRVAYQEFVRPFGEEGRARAEFIEWQIQGRIARFSNLLRHAARCLTETRRLTWSEGLAQRTWSMRYHRGFVSAVKVDLGSLAASPERFFGVAPLEHLDLFDIKGNLDGFRSLAGRPEWCQIRSISIADAHLGDVDFARVIDAIAHANLEWLGLTGNDLGMAGLEALARATPRMPGLRAVWVDGGNAVEVEPQREWTLGEEQIIHVKRDAEVLRAAFGPLRWLDGAGGPRLE